jgi:hypothetical protein
MKHPLARVAAAGAVALAFAACNSDRLTVPNFQNPTPESIAADPIQAMSFLTQGVLRNDRDNATTFISGVGILGRESYNYTPTEGRNTSGWLTSDVNQSTSFGGVSNWTGFYQTLRNLKNLVDIAEGTPEATLPADRKAAALGFAHTMEALTLLYVIELRHDIGAVVELADDPTQLTPFVSRDSVYSYIIGRLDEAKAELEDAGAASFPFALHSGFTGFNTPATFLQFNRAIAARVNAYRASLGTSGCGAPLSATCYTEVLTNLSESFLNPSGSLTAGVYRPYSAAANDVQNGLSNAATSNQVAHFRVDSGVQLQAGGAKDARWTAKVITLTSPKNAATASIGVPTSFDWAVYPLRDTRVAIIRNEELILLRAEARWFTGDKPGAIADLNIVRTTSGGLPAHALATALLWTDDEFIDALLYERRWSLAYEGHRWVDMRRFGRLDLLTLDLPNHITTEQLPIPQAECLQRVNASPELQPPANSRCETA